MIGLRHALVCLARLLRAACLPHCPRPRVGHIEQVALRIVDLLQVRLVGHFLDPRLQWNSSGTLRQAHP